MDELEQHVIGRRGQEQEEESQQKEEVDYKCVSWHGIDIETFEPVFTIACIYCGIGAVASVFLCLFTL